MDASLKKCSTPPAQTELIRASVRGGESVPVRNRPTCLRPPAWVLSSSPCTHLFSLSCLAHPLASIPIQVSLIPTVMVLNSVPNFKTSFSKKRVSCLWLFHLNFYSYCFLHEMACLSGFWKCLPSRNKQLFSMHTGCMGYPLKLFL